MTKPGFFQRLKRTFYHCPHWRRCTLYRESQYTCNFGFGDHCGKAREFNRILDKVQGSGT